MKRLAAYLVVICLSVSALAAASSSVSMPAFWRYAHPEAKALIGIEWNRVMNSSLGQQLRQKIQEAPEAGLAELGVFDSVSRILISSPGKPEGAAGAETPGVVTVQGDFNVDQIREVAARKMTGSTSYRSIEILEQAKEGEQSMALALVDNRTLVIGDMESVAAAIDHYLSEDPSQASNPLYLRASELADGNDIWVVAHASPSDFSSDSNQQAPFLKDVTSLEAGLSLRDGLGIELNLGTESDESAAELATGLQLMLGMFMGAGSNQPNTPNLAEKLHIVADQSLVRLSMNLDQQELEQSFQKMGAKMMTASLGGNAADIPLQGKVGGTGDWNWGESQPAPVAIQPAPEPRNQVIRIYGLEEGTREIPLGN